MFWDVRLLNGSVRAQTDDGINQPTDITSSGPPVNDGSIHSVSVQRVAKVLTIYVDRNAVGSSAASDMPAAFAQLAPLVSGTDVCSSTAPLMGTITDLCVSSP
jgi:hypothetical protein